MSLKLMSAVLSSATVAQNRQQDSTKLINQLLECVQQCQKRFGGKTELATEFDSCVAALCLALETVLLHGLRPKPLIDGQTSTLKQVSELVSNSLHLINENLSFWPFVSNHLTKHENERYLVLKQIWTDTGRGKAWIRSALNEKSLERYFHTLLSNKKLLKTYYEDWALLCDDEKSNLLPNMAAGLGSILFAVSIDKAEFNSGNAIEKMDKLKSMVEPIIDAPIPENTIQKKKRKIPKQIISFDDDETALSSSVPSSSSSITSDNVSQNEAKLVKNPEKLELAKEVSEKPKRKLSIETSGSREKFFNNIEGPLTPVQANIGELTPVSVEKSDSPDSSDNKEDAAIDITNVFDDIEKKNLEIIRLDEKVNLITKENENLKEQLKKYISAVQMLKKGDRGVETAFEGLDISDNKQPDYQNEAKIFEQKLVQVAEMHAELMDFNVLLQQQLCSKDKMVERLRSELEELRGPLPLDDSTEDQRHAVNIWIPSAFLTGSGSSAHHVYQIFLRAGCEEWNIYRRYAQFYALHSDLKKLDNAVASFDFPPKKSIGKKDATLVETRRKRLQTYLRKVLAHWPELSQCNTRYLLEQHLAFFKDQESDKKVLPQRSSGNENHYAGL